MTAITLKFDVMWKNELVGRIEIVEGVLVKNESYNKDWYKNYWTKMTSATNILMSLRNRCFDRARPDKADLLNYLGLEEYNVYEIIRRTHGVILGDFIWFRFDDDYKGVCWETVNPKSDRYKRWWTDEKLQTRE
jgi:hypothetical protein